MPLLEGDGAFMLSTQPVSKGELALLQGKVPRIRLRSGGYAVLLYELYKYTSVCNCSVGQDR